MFEEKNHLNMIKQSRWIKKIYTCCFLQLSRCNKNFELRNKNIEHCLLPLFAAFKGLRLKSQFYTSFLHHDNAELIRIRELLFWSSHSHWYWWFHNWYVRIYKCLVSNGKYFEKQYYWRTERLTERST